MLLFVLHRSHSSRSCFPANALNASCHLVLSRPLNGSLCVHGFCQFRWKTFNFCRPIWTGSCPDVRAQRPPRTVHMHLCSPHTIAIVMAKPCITAKAPVCVCVCYPRYYAIIKYLFKSLLRRASCCAALFNRTSGCFWILEARTSLPSGSWKLPLLTGMR